MRAALAFSVALGIAAAADWPAAAEVALEGAPVAACSEEQVLDAVAGPERSAVIDRATFFELLAAGGDAGSIEQRAMSDALLDAWEDRPGMSDLRWLAYAMATARRDILNRPADAAAVLDGMVWGWFTGRCLGLYFPKDGPADWQGASRIVDGPSPADLTAAEARVYLAALEIAAAAPTRQAAAQLDGR